MALSSKRRSDLVSGPYTRLLAEHEEALAELYKCFALAIPEARDFWEQMSKEELSHEKLLKGLARKFSSQKWSFARPKFTTSAIIESCDRLVQMKLFVAKKGISMRDAMKYALEIERSLMESEYFQIIDADNAVIMNVLQSLRAYTYAHIRNLEKEAKRLKWRLGGKKISEDFKKIVLANTNLKSNIKAQQAPIIGGLVAMEEAAASLYKTFALRLKETSGFWEKIAAEEMQHAAMLRKLYDVLDRGKVFYNLSKFKMEDMLKDTDKILHMEYDARFGELSLYSAINQALKVERMLTECKFYKTVKSDAPEFRFLAERMVEQSKEHLRRMEEEAGRAIDMGLLAAKPTEPLLKKKI